MVAVSLYTSGLELSRQQPCYRTRCLNAQLYIALNSHFLSSSHLPYEGLLQSGLAYRGLVKAFLIRGMQFMLFLSVNHRSAAQKHSFSTSIYLPLELPFPSL